MRHTVIAVALCFGFFSAGLNAATVEAAGTQFDSRIDTWVEGTIITLDADSQKFSVRGVKMPYASAHAAMNQDIQNKTAKLEGTARVAKEDEARRSWSDKLAAAQKEEKGREGDFNFGLPAKGELAILNDHQLRGADFLTQNRVVAVTGRTTATVGKDGTEIKVSAQPRDESRTNAQKEAVAIMTLKDLKIGDRIQVGYDSGVITNEAFVVVKSGDKMNPAGQR